METHTTALRNALRDGNTESLESAAAKLIAPLSEPLLRLCRIHVDNSPLRDTMEASDLAQEAWAKTLRYLGGPNGDRVQDDAHFRRLLHTAARTLFLDHLDALPRENVASLDDTMMVEGEEGEALAERLASTQGNPQDVLLFGGGEASGLLLEALFGTDEAAFRAACRKKPRRRARYYQAYVLYQLGVFLRDEAENKAQVTAPLLRDYADALNIPAPAWAVVENAALAPSDNAALMGVINELCDANLQEGNYLAVLRHELNGLVHG